MSQDDTQVSAKSRDGSTVPGMPVEGETFAERYYIERLLGRGGMGMVYLAVQSPLDRRVALKVLRPPSEPSLDPQFYSRFLREAEAAARLQHPNTITIYDFGNTDEGLPYIVMEYLEGQDLRQLLASEWPFSLERTLHVASQVCKSLKDAHSKGMIHRDLKPANVLLVKRDDDEDFVKVFDFGLVKFRDEDQDLTQAGIFLGSPRYTFPEALDSKAVVDERADIYSAGILIYCMVAGRPPFNGEPMAVLSAHLNETPTPMSQVDPRACSCAALEAVVARCLLKDPRDRYQSMRELQAALREVSRILETGEESLELDPSGAWPASETGFDEEERTTQRDLEVVEPLHEEAAEPQTEEAVEPVQQGAVEPHAEGFSLPFRPAMMAILFVLLASAAMMTLRPADPEPAPVPEPVEAVPTREVGVTLHSDEDSLQVSYMAIDGRWRPLGTLSDELRERWNSGSTEPWWTAQVEADQQVLSLLLVGSSGAGRRLELPIVDGQVRFDTAKGDKAEQPPGAQPGATEAPPRPVPQSVPAPVAPGAVPEPEAGSREADREAEKPTEISPGYKDNPY